MGILDRLFGTGTSAKSPARKPATPPTARPVPKAAPQKPPVAAPQTPTATPTAAPKPTENAPKAAPAVVEAAAAVVEQPVAEVTEAAAEAVAEVADIVAEPVAEDAPVEVAAIEEATDTVEVTAEPVEVEVEAITEPTAEPAADSAEADAQEVVIDAHLQKRLDTYFARLRQDFPDGNIVRLNTQHKKLAERGAELRRLCGYEGKLDEFFALGGFTYQRSAGGRPSLPADQTASVEARLRAQFPEDVPTVLAVQQADHRLYLDLRAVARRENCTVGEYLDRFRAD